MTKISRIAILSTFLPFLFLPSFSQKVNFDQLKKDILEAQSNRDKATAMMVLGGSLSPRESDLTFNYADSILLISDPNDAAFYKNASTYLLAVGNYRKGNLAEAKKLFKESYVYFSTQSGDIQFTCLNFLGISFLRTNQADSAVNLFQQIISESDNPKMKLSAHGNLGNAYRKLGNYGKAIDHFEQCVELDSTNQFSVLNSYINISSMFTEMELFDQGLATLNQFDISQLSPQPIKSVYFNEIGNLYYRKKQYDSAIQYLTMGYELARDIGQNQLTIKNRLLLSEIYLTINKMDSSLALLKAVKKDLHHYPTLTVLLDLNHKSANYFLKSEAYDSSIFYAKEVLKIAEKNNLQHQIKNSNELIAQSYEAKGNTDSSAFYYKKQAEWQELSLVSDKEKFAQDAKARFQLSEKEEAISKMKAESSQLLSWQKRLIIILTIALFAAFFLFKKFKKSKIEVQKQASQNEILTKVIEKNKSEIIELKSRAILPIDDIISIKVDGHYLEFSLVSKSTPEVDRNQIKAILASLPSKFVQIHRSFVVNVDHIKIKQATKVILKDGKELPVSRTFKDSLNKAMNLD